MAPTTPKIPSICAVADCRVEVAHRCDSRFATPSGLRDREDRDGSHRKHASGGRERDRHGVRDGRFESRYCHRHTCSYFAWEGCTSEKTVYDSVCAFHTQCPVSNCPNGKVQCRFQNTEGASLRYYRLDFCAEHMCSVPDCVRMRVAPRSERAPPQVHCEIHACDIEGCKRPRVEEHKNHCQDHECRYPHCQLIVAERATLCIAHLKCEVHACNSDKQLIPNSTDYLQYCAPHAKCETHNCTGQREYASHHCSKHACLERLCDLGAGSLRYCERHRCSQLDCDAPRGFDEKKARKALCNMHSCRVYGCRSAVGTDELYCTDHSCCERNCRSESAVDGKCAEHFKTQLKKQAKAEAKAEVKGEMDELTRSLEEKGVTIRDLQDRAVRQTEIRPRPPDPMPVEGAGVRIGPTNLPTPPLRQGFLPDQEVWAMKD